ncbi:tetratricopeptide repeat-containing sulfotransferase family protein [Methylomonas fluvii]|uniref:Sulfotransferase n=1 Tax=Methylomonas fluvii TaxID=1854564 RepID=A0ABR9DFC4_9GAMM|nr:tetratricopeptide repeat-containing sulfotransferase family protein [Methylomonas fluvii]MBD9361783.1 sulfotransferase [Methylomonas fluvii]
MKNTAAVNAKFGRNDRCPCGSGKKYKACCLKQAEAASRPVKPSVDDALKQAWQAVARRDMAGTLLGFRQVLAIQPDHAEALAGLGQALCWQQQRREGLAYLQQAARQLEIDAQQTRNIRFMLELAEQLHHWGDLDTALKLTELAVKLEPENPAALNNRALYLTRVNRFEEALPFASKVCELRPDDPACNNMLAVLEAHLNRLPAAKQRFQAVIAANRNMQQTARAWQELVGVLDKLEEYEASFAACQQAKALYKQLPELSSLDAGQVFRAIQRNKQGFDQTLLHRWALSDFADHLPAPTFLLGFLRSGTTLTEQVLAAHPDVFTSDENDLIHGLIQELQRLSGVREDIPAALRQLGLDDVRKLRAYYWRRVGEEYGADALNKCFIDKVALNSIDIGLISCLFPEARIIFALRDPRDVCLSCFQQAFKPSSVTVNLLSWEGVAKQYAAVMDLWLYIKPMMQPRYMELRYEDTVNDFENSFRRVFTLLDLEWVAEVSAFHEKAKGRYIATPSFAAVAQPIYSRSVARWQHYERFYEPVLPILAPYIDAFGYE